ncbi:MAG: right-handed parallel beta-helix repeat-containing protein [Candidatus Thorarchaeota archaeon]
MKKSVSVLVVAILFCLMLVPQGVYDSNYRISNSRQYLISDSTPHDEIVITHNDNFTTQGWEGNGTVDDPFIISNLEIKSDTTCVNISNTDVYFVVENCWMMSDSVSWSGFGIFLNSVQNGEIRDVIITRKEVGVSSFGTSDTTFSNITIYNSGLGILLDQSTNCYIVNSTIMENSEGSAITLLDSDHCDIIHNHLQGNRVGFLSNSSEWMEVTNNTIVGNSEYGIQTTSGTKKLSAYWNWIGWNGQNAIDNGSTKFWDNGNYGNWWSDGDNESDYFVPGSANAKDRHPQAWNDTMGPDINIQLTQSESAGEFSVHVYVEAIDDVAVSQVILSTSLDNGSTWSNVTMDWSYDSWTASVDDLSAGSIIHYVVYASDYASNWEVTSDEEYTILLETDSTTTSSTTGTDTTTVPTSGTGTNTITGPGGDIPGIDPLAIAAIIGVAAAIGIVAFLMYQYPSKFGRNK